MPPSAVTSTSSIIIRITTVHPFATSWPSSPKGDARTLRDLLSVSYGIVSILVISRCAAPPYPAAPDFPPSGGQNKTPRNTLFINGSAVSTGYSATACGGKVVAPATKGGIAFPRPSGRLYGFRCPRQRHIKLPSEPARSVGRTHHSVRSTRTIEPGRREAPEPSSLKGACP